MTTTTLSMKQALEDADRLVEEALISRARLYALAGIPCPPIQVRPPAARQGGQGRPHEAQGGNGGNGGATRQRRKPGRPAKAGLQAAAAPSR